MCKDLEASRDAHGELVLTSSLAGVGEDDDIVEGPGVVGMRGVEGELGCPLSPQGYQEGGMDHGHREAAPALAVLGGEVVSRAAVVALGKGVTLNYDGVPPSPEHCPPATAHRPQGPSPQPYLGCDPTPEIGVVGLGVQHWGHHGQPLLYQKPQRLVVGQNVVCIGKLWRGGCHRP